MLSYRDHKGHLRRWEAVERVNCKGVVVIVPFTPEGEVLLTRQYRPVLDSFVVEFPAGLNDKGESMEEAAAASLEKMEEIKQAYKAETLGVVEETKSLSPVEEEDVIGESEEDYSEDEDMEE